MRLALQIFRKDLERLWWAVLLTWALLAMFAFGEARRAAIAFPTGPQSGSWMNLAVPFGWCLLVALVIRQDPLVGDRQFWVALPCGWRALTAAKFAFIVASIQIPYFLATAAILAARGFNPGEHVPHLFWKQLVLLGLLLPAVAVAATVRNVTQFMLLLITAASAVVLLSSRLNQSYMANESWDVRWPLTLSILNVGALIVIVIQFSRRYTIRSRAISVITALAAASLFNWLPRDTSAAIDIAFSPAQKPPTPVSVSLSPDQLNYSEQLRWYNFQLTTVVIPIAFSGFPATGPDTKMTVDFDEISLEVLGSDGERYQTQGENRIEARLENSRQVLRFYIPAVWKRVSGGSVTIHGKVLVRAYRLGESTAIPLGESAAIPGVGRCSNIVSRDSEIVLRKFSSVECESPEVAPRDIRVRLLRGDVWQGLGSLRENASYRQSYVPQDPWLSPVRHGRFGAMGVTLSPWGVARQTQFDSALIDYSLPNIDLNRFVVHQPVKPESSK